jgi:NADH:ubiquinone oxidoreductase subunit 3 (subunit A)
MGAALVVAIVIGVFFAIGLLVGGTMVIALPLLRDRRPGRRKRRSKP